MNKLVIPAILAVTVMVAGLFAFAPVEQASTVHALAIADIRDGGTILSETVTTLNLNDDEAFHHFVLESEVPYTIHDIEVKGTLVDASDGCDEILVRAESYPAEYGLDVITSDNDGRNDTIKANRTVVDGNDAFNPLTHSVNAERADNDESILSFTEKTNAVVQITFNECGGNDTADFTAVVTFYLTGPTEAQATLTLDDNIDPGDTI